MKKEFTAENKATLEKLFVDFCFSGDSLEGKFGANTLNPYELLNETSLSTLENLYETVTKSAEAINGKSRWRLTEHQLTKQERLTRWAEFLDLLIGYRLDLQEKVAKATKAKTLREELNRLKEESKTPEVRLAEMEAELALLEV